MSKPCNKNYNDGGAHTVKIIDGVPYCPSCNLPTKDHKS